MKDEDGIVNIHGKSYETVASRVGKFRAKYPDWSIQTELVLDDNNRIVMKSVIGNSDGMIVASGYAEEVRGSSNINTTSALENAETSAIGRALSALGMGGTSYASADEVANAIGQQNEKALYARFKDFTTALVENFKSVDAVKLGIMDAQATETVKNLLKQTYPQPLKHGVNSIPRPRQPYGWPLLREAALPQLKELS